MSPWRLALAIGAITLQGCGALETREELAWQTLHAVDTAQTNAIVGSCHEEVHPVTRAMIGAHPSHEAVIAWGVGSAVAHAAVSQFLIDHDHPRLFRAWQWITITEKGLMIGRNHELGLRVDGRDVGCTN